MMNTVSVETPLLKHQTSPESSIPWKMFLDASDDHIGLNVN